MWRLKLYIPVHFYSLNKVKDKLYQLLGKFAMVKEASNLKVGKLTTVSKQKNANYHLPEEAD